MDRVRVLSIVSSLCFGGAEKHTVALLNELELSRFQLSLAYLKPVEALLPQLHQERLHAILSLNVQAKLDWGAVRRLSQFIETERIDVVLCTNEYPALYALLASRLGRRRPKLVEVFHTTLHGTAKERLQMAIYRHVFRRFDLLVYVSSNQQAYWRTKGLRAKRDIVIHNGIDTDFFQDRYSPEEKAALRAKLGFQHDDYIVAICAALRPEKAHGDLLRALALLRSRNCNAKGLIIGDGSERGNIEATIDQLSLRDAVVITGFQSDVRPLVACSDVVVLASHAVETFSVAALEAMAIGKPMVLTRIGGADEQVVNEVEGFLFEPGDIEALATHLDRLSAVDKRTAMGKAAMSKVRQHFSQQKMVDAFSAQLCATAPRTASLANGR
jgi:glycosyltransferase involved in cell wall biosynthesis